MNTPKPYQAIIVLGCNIRKTEQGFMPATYADHDQYGMLAGHMNVLAATLLWAEAASNTFVFSTGTSAKTKAAFGDDAPTEASVYSRDFLHQLTAMRHNDDALAARPNPDIILEDVSVNTLSNLREIYKIIVGQGWNDVAIVSARYHIPRVAAIHTLLQKTEPLTNVAIDFIMSEDVVVDQLPGLYDQDIADAYQSEWGRKRLAIEASGIEDITAGRYATTEFQFVKK